MVKLLRQAWCGEFVRLWARVAPCSRDDGLVVVKVVTEPLHSPARLTLGGDVLVEAMEKQEPWPGEVVRSFVWEGDRLLAEAEHDLWDAAGNLAQARHDAEVAFYGEDAKAA